MELLRFADGLDEGDGKINARSPTPPLKVESIDREIGKSKFGRWTQEASFILQISSTMGATG